MFVATTAQAKVCQIALLFAIWLEPICAFAAGESTKARDQYDQATTLYSQKNYDAAKKLLIDLWSKSRTHDVATMLGQIEKTQGHHAEAAKYFAYAVANFPPTEEVKRLEPIKGALHEAQKRVLTFNIKITVDGATVSIDGLNYDTTPLATPVFLDPGAHIILVRKEGFKTADRNVTAVAGATDSWDVTLQPNDPPATSTPLATSTGQSTVKVEPFATEPPKDTVSSKPNPWILVGGGAVTVGALVTGLAFNSKANTAYDDAKTLKSTHDNDYCSDPSNDKSYCSSLEEKAKDGDRFRNYSTGAFVIGGLAAVGTAVYWFLPRAKSTSPVARVHLAPTVATDSSGTTGLNVLGTF